MLVWFMLHPFAGICAGADIASGGAGGLWAEGPGGDWKRVRLNRDTPAHLVLDGSLGRQSDRHQMGAEVEVNMRSLVQHEDCPQVIEGRKGIG